MHNSIALRMTTACIALLASMTFTISDVRADDEVTNYYSAVANKNGETCKITFTELSDGTVAVTSRDAKGRKKDFIIKRSFDGATSTKLIKAVRKNCPAGCLDDSIDVEYTYNGVKGSTKCNATRFDDNNCNLEDLAAYTHYSDEKCSITNDTDDNGCDLWALHTNWPTATYDAKCVPLDANGCDMSNGALLPGYTYNASCGILDTWGCAIAGLSAGQSHINAQCNVGDSNGCNLTWLSTNYGAGYTYNASCAVYNTNSCAMASLTSGQYYASKDATCAKYDANGCPYGGGYTYSKGSCSRTVSKVVQTIAAVTIINQAYTAPPAAVVSGGTPIAD